MEAPFSVLWNNFLIRGTYKKGPGIPWIFIHGFPQNSESWKMVFPYVDHYYALDLPGFGNSEGTTQNLSRVSEAVEAIRLHFRLLHIIVAGHSMGGYIALEYCKQFGGNVAGLALVHSHPYEDDESRKAKRNQSIALISNGQKFEFCKVFLSSLFSSDFASMNPEIINQMIQTSAVLPDDVLSHALMAMRDRPSNTSVLESAGFPVLFVLGELDTAIPMSFALEQTYLASIGMIKIARGIGHQIMQENPKLLAQFFNEFKTLCNAYPPKSML